ncbi:MAG: hypothetical protein AB8E82_06275 [Aureispira sp.]
MAAMFPKIQTLLDTHQGENTYIAVYLMIHQLGYSPEQALKAVPFVETAGSGQGREFTWELYLGNMELEYKVVEGYVPYMGADITAARILKVEHQGKYELVPDLAGYLAIQDDQTKEEIQQMIQEDYHQLIPQLWQWLDNPLDALW